VAEAFHALGAATARIGLEFNIAKCEVIPAAGSCAVVDATLFPDSVIHRPTGGFELFGGAYWL